MDFQAFLAMLKELKSKASEFMQALYTLDTMKSRTVEVPEMEKERLRLLSRAGNLKRRIDAISGRVDATINHVRSMLPGWLGGPEDEGLGNLQALQLLGIAAVVAAVGYLTSWLGDYVVFAQKVDEVDRLVARGMSRANAWKQVSRASNTGALSKAGDLVRGLLPLAAIAAAFYFVPKFFPGFKTMR